MVLDNRMSVYRNDVITTNNFILNFPFYLIFKLILINACLDEKGEVDGSAVLFVSPDSVLCLVPKFLMPKENIC